MNDFPSISIVSGCPGSGKSTVSRALALAMIKGVHIPSDGFYEFPAAPIDPTHRDSHQQNTVIMRALARSALAFVEGGYQVVLDGIFGPWFLPTLRGEMRDEVSVGYIVLRVPIELALERVRKRDGPGMSAKVEATVASFADLGEFERHAIDAGHLDAAQLFDALRTGLASGRYDLVARRASEGEAKS